MRTLLLLAAFAGCGNDGVCKPTGTYNWGSACSSVDCSGKPSCDVTCAADQICGDLNCSGDQQCHYNCEQGATCQHTDCTGTGVCDVQCLTGSTCEVDCDRAASCNLGCASAQCVLKCGTSTSCAIGECVGGSGLTTCGNGVYACNRACP
jgi:hypothetical protein